MSKDAELLRAIGLGPEERPEFWCPVCPKCGSTCVVAYGSDALICLGGDPASVKPLMVAKDKPIA